jgi:hypothetical protein
MNHAKFVNCQPQQGSFEFDFNMYPKNISWEYINIKKIPEISMYTKITSFGRWVGFGYPLHIYHFVNQKIMYLLRIHCINLQALANLVLQYIFLCPFQSC